jgi:hypothetical protein
MLDLFDMPVLPGLATMSDLITANEEQALIAAFDQIDLSPFRFQGWTGHRLTASYGKATPSQSGCFLSATAQQPSPGYPQTPSCKRS